MLGILAAIPSEAAGAHTKGDTRHIVRQRKGTTMNRTTKRVLLMLGAALVIAALTAGTAFAVDSTSFRMVRSSNAVTNDCLEGANGHVTINSLGPVEAVSVELNNLPPNREFDLFVIQQPNAPFGASWYQGDLVTDANGHAKQRFLGRFSIETFTVAPGSVAAPVVHEDPPFPDASTNPAFAPVHQYHLGLWFGTAGAARAAGCTGDALVSTPFNGVHNAGVQALSTRQFDALNGPLRQIQ